MAEERDLKAVRLIQERAEQIADAHTDMANELNSVKRLLSALPGADTVMQGEEFELHVAAISAELATG